MLPCCCLCLNVCPFKNPPRCNLASPGLGRVRDEWHIPWEGGSDALHRAGKATCPPSSLGRGRQPLAPDPPCLPLAQLVNTCRKKSQRRNLCRLSGASARIPQLPQAQHLARRHHEQPRRATDSRPGRRSVAGAAHPERRGTRRPDCHQGRSLAKPITLPRT